MAERCRGWGLDERVTGDGCLLVSELVTNALLHGGGGIRLLVRLVLDGLQIEVCDGGGGVPRQRSSSEDDEHGRGLAIVAAFALEWGHDARPEGTCVWFTIAR